MHLLSFNDLVFVLSLGTVIVSASPIVGRKEGQLLGYSYPSDLDGHTYQESKRIVPPSNSRTPYPIYDKPSEDLTPNTWECKIFDTNNLLELVEEKLRGDQKKEIPFSDISGSKWGIVIPMVLVDQRPPTLDCYRLSDAHKTMDRPKADWDVLKQACPKGTLTSV
ncbi:hypothetical protein F5876DRAFT_81090 [Lentinula aff. lateritia]|uniref:Uncharacterized protein n=1 Tax=Lentinula aff. lateritia TaxID=2804960 RepID=A0ACC1TMV6_9AGAR|nr:hypothetical protein F5876DRAFT_81090 [Lentinula aff. lateritia]